MDLDDTKSAYQLNSNRKQAAVDPNVRDLDTGKILHTDIHKYLETGAHVTCISCQHCIREKAKVLQFKYSKHLNTDYGSRFLNNSGAKR